MVFCLFHILFIMVFFFSLRYNQSNYRIEKKLCTSKSMLNLDCGQIHYCSKVHKNFLFIINCNCLFTQRERQMMDDIWKFQKILKPFFIQIAIIFLKEKKNICYVFIMGLDRQGINRQCFLLNSHTFTVKLHLKQNKWINLYNKSRRKTNGKNHRSFFVIKIFFLKSLIRRISSFKLNHCFLSVMNKRRWFPYANFFSRVQNDLA